MATNNLKRHKTDHRFFSGLGILISTVGLSGFWFRYFGPIIGNTYPPAGVPLHLHGWSFFAWLFLFPLQAILIDRGSRALHKILGQLGLVLVLVMTLTGLLVVSVRADEAAREGEPLVWLLYGPLIFSNLVLFVAFYCAAILMAASNRWQAHKRLIVIASGIGVSAGLGRWVMTK